MNTMTTPLKHVPLHAVDLVVERQNAPTVPSPAHAPCPPRRSDVECPIEAIQERDHNKLVTSMGLLSSRMDGVERKLDDVETRLGKNGEKLEKLTDAVKLISDWVLEQKQLPKPSYGTALAKERLSFRKTMWNDGKAFLTHKVVLMVLGAGAMNVVIRYSSPEVISIVKVLLGVG